MSHRRRALAIAAALLTLATGGPCSTEPTPQLLTSTSLDALFAQGSFRAKAYLAADSDTVVLVALGQ